MDGAACVLNTTAALQPCSLGLAVQMDPAKCGPAAL